MQKKIKILYLDHTAKWGGGEVAIFNLIQALDKSIFEPVVVLASDGMLGERLREARIDVIVAPISHSIVDIRKDSIDFKSLFRFRQFFELIRYSLRLAKLAKNRHIDVIHANSLKSDIYGGIAGRLAKIPVIWHIRDNITSDYLPGAVAYAFRLLAKIVPTLVVANSQSTLRNISGIQSSAVSSQSSIAPQKPGILFDMLADKDVQDAEAIGFSEEPIITLVGRITEWKGQRVAIDALSDVLQTYPKARLRIVGAAMFGEEDYDASIHRQAASLGIADHVEFMGFRNDIPDLLNDSDIVLHASIIGEPFGQVVIEGMAAGKPVIATDGGALPEIVIPGATGLLVPLGDSKAMAEAIKQLLSNPVNARMMGIAGRRRVYEKFTIRHTAQMAQDIYLSLMNHPLSNAPRVITDGVGMAHMDGMLRTASLK